MSRDHGIVEPVEALTGSMRDFRELRGVDLMARVEGFYHWQESRRLHGLWPYSKSTKDAPRAICTAKDDSGTSFWGLNFASQDYLGLSSDPEIKEVAKAVIDEYGVHSAGSSALAGNTMSGSPGAPGSTSSSAPARRSSPASACQAAPAAARLPIGSLCQAAGRIQGLMT